MDLMLFSAIHMLIILVWLFSLHLVNFALKSLSIFKWFEIDGCCVVNFHIKWTTQLKLFLIMENEIFDLSQKK